MTGEAVPFSGPGPGGSDNVETENDSQASHLPYQPYIDWEKINFSSTEKINGNQKKESG